jgi:hypothetical protein
VDNILHFLSEPPAAVGFIDMCWEGERLHPVPEFSIFKAMEAPVTEHPFIVVKLPIAGAAESRVENANDRLDKKGVS